MQGQQQTAALGVRCRRARSAAWIAGVVSLSLSHSCSQCSALLRSSGTPSYSSRGVSPHSIASRSSASSSSSFALHAEESCRVHVPQHSVLQQAEPRRRDDACTRGHCVVMSSSRGYSDAYSSSSSSSADTARQRYNHQQQQQRQTHADASPQLGVSIVPSSLCIIKNYHQQCFDKSASIVI
jgi:hypothetical protein